MAINMLAKTDKDQNLVNIFHSPNTNFFTGEFTMECGVIYVETKLFFRLVGGC